MSQTLLLPIDGSETALRAVDWLVRTLPDWRETPIVHLLNVQPSLHGDIGRFVSAAQLKEFHKNAGDQALAEASKRLTAAGIAHQCHVRVGESAELIRGFASETACTQIVLGTRGHGGLTGMLLGSVASKLAHLSPVALTLVR